MRFSCTAGADAIRPVGRERGRWRGGPVARRGATSAGGRRRGRVGRGLLAVEAAVVRGGGGDLVAREARLVLRDRLRGGRLRLVEVLRREVRPGDAGAEREQRPAGALHARGDGGGAGT